MSILKQPVSRLKGIGPKKQEYLRTMGIESLRDLLYCFPREHEDRTTSYTIARLPHGQRAGARVMVSGSPNTRRIRNNLIITRVPVTDGTDRGYAVWFNNPYIVKLIKRNQTYDIFGRVERRMGEVQIQNPQIKRVSDCTKEYQGDIVPIYSKHGRLESRDFERMIKKALEAALGSIEDIFPDEFRKAYRLEEINYCLENIHFPVNGKSFEKARHRLVFEEFFLLQLGLLLIKKEIGNRKEGIVFPVVSQEDILVDILPFQLTNAQKKAWIEIKEDMEKGIIMNRLLQGDVGSGKTVIAALALLKAAANGYQGALMVPTEILAEQHFKTLTDMLSEFGYKIDLLIGSCTAGQREEIYGRIKKGQTDIVIGTHALIQEGLEFARLGLVITDEQHRFGVRQRYALTAKGVNPDILVMTATPIPRSLALILYGDMDLSVIDQMPPGRKKIETYVTGQKSRDRVYGFVAKQLKEGRQAYVVCPLIEESEMIDARSATEVYQELFTNYFRPYRLELMHGKVNTQKKEKIMRDFRDGLIDLLVSTTVIEVGVNVPNASVMVVENSERFGLAQLHQLRGRVGRGGNQSYCILINGSNSRVAHDRMKIMAESDNGFEISEKDLQIRGPGDFFGTRQHGLPELRVSRLPEDIEVLKLVQPIALKMADSPDFYTDKRWIKLKERVKELFEHEHLTLGVI